MHSCQRNNANWLRASASWRREYFMWIFVYGNSDRTGRWFLKKVFSFLWEEMERKQSLWLTWSERNFLSTPNKISCLRAKSLQSCPTLCDPKDEGFLCPWDSPGNDTGVGCHFLLQGIFPTQGLNPRLIRILHWQGVLTTSASWVHLLPNCD